MIENLSDELENFLTVSQAAAELGVTPGRIRQMIAEGKLSAIKIENNYRGYWLIPKGRVAEFKNKLKGKETEEKK